MLLNSVRGMCVLFSDIDIPTKSELKHIIAKK